MLMVIFGAGASYDSVPARPALDGERVDIPRPPLANRLFDNRTIFARTIRDFPRCNAIIPYLRNPNEPVEHVLERLQTEAGEYPVRHKQLASIRYYLAEALRVLEHDWKIEALGVTNYKSLLDEIERLRPHDETVALVTFNYDTLLEHSLADVSLTVQSLSDYTSSHPHYKVFKLHGSTNWAREVHSPIDAHAGDTWAAVNEMIERAPELDISQDYVIVPQTGPFPISWVGRQALFPAIAIPVESKSNFECPSQHLEDLCKLLPKINSVLTVGWRATESHFLDLLAKHLPDAVRAHVVADRRDAGEVAARIQRVLSTRRVHNVSIFPEGGFTNFIARNALARFLARPLA